MTAAPKQQLEESKARAKKEVRATIKARRASIAFAAPELQDEKWRELEHQLIACVERISL